MDGYLKIKTKIDNKEVDKDIAELENKIKKLQQENVTASNEQTNLEKEINQYEELKQSADAYQNKIKELQAEKEQLFKANPELAVSVDTPEYANVNAQITEMKNRYAQATKEIDKQAPKIEKLYTKLDKVKAKQTQNNTQISLFKQKIESIKTTNIEKSLNSVGKNIQNQIGKIGKMAMAVVGIRTAWHAVRGAISTVTQYNSQVSADFEYMRYCIGNMLVPVVQGLIKLLYTVLSYVNAIANAWFGVNLFGNASVKNFKKMQASAGSTAKSAKEIEKSLQGFDEKNVLQNNSEASSGGGGGVSAPSMDLSGMQAEVPAWIEWIMDNKELLISTLLGIAGGIIAIKLGIKGLKALGIGVAITGIALIVQSILDCIEDPSWENFGRVLASIGLILAGLSLYFKSLHLAVAGAIVAIIALIVANWDTICEILRRSGSVDI